MTLSGKTRLNENRVLAFSMPFQCVDNGSKCICNVTQSTVKMLTMFNQHLRMDEKCFSMHWQLFPTFDPNATQNVENKDISPRCNKADHTLSAQPVALCLQATNIQLNIKIVHLREFNFV